MAKISFVATEDSELTEKVLAAVQQTASQYGASVSPYDIAESEGLAVRQAEHTMTSLANAGKLQMVQGGSGYLPQMQ